MDDILAQLKSGHGDDIDLKVMNSLKGFDGMNLDEQKAAGTFCVKFMHACQGVIEKLSEGQRMALVKALSHCYRCIEASCITEQLKDTLTVTKLSYHIMAKMLNAGDYRAAVGCSDYVLKELLSRTKKVTSPEIDNIAQNASAIMWNRGKCALDPNVPKETGDITLQLSMLSQSLCFATICSSLDSQLLAANIERISSRMVQTVDGLASDCEARSAVLNGIMSFYRDLLAMPRMQSSLQLRLLTCAQRICILVQCQDLAAAQKHLETDIKGSVPQPVLPTVACFGCQAIADALQLYIFANQKDDLPAHARTAPEKRISSASLASLADLLTSLAGHEQADTQLQNDLLWPVVIDAVRLLLESLRESSLVMKDLSGRSCQCKHVTVELFVKSVFGVLSRCQRVLLEQCKTDSQSIAFASSSSSNSGEGKRILTKRIQTSMRAGVSATAVLLMSFGRGDAEALQSSPRQSLCELSTSADMNEVQHILEGAVSILKSLVKMEPELTKELAYAATLIHNAGLKLVAQMQLDGASIFLKMSASIYKTCHQFKASRDTQEKWQSSLTNLVDCCQRSGHLDDALWSAVEMLNAGAGSEKCLQLWIGAKRDCVKRWISSQNKKDTCGVKLSLMKTTMRAIVQTLCEGITEEEIVELLTKELRAYIAYSSRANTLEFYVAELAVIEDLLTSHAVAGCSRAFCLLRRAYLHETLRGEHAQDGATPSRRSLLADCEAALISACDGCSGKYSSDIIALAFFMGYTIQHVSQLVEMQKPIQSRLQQSSTGDVDACVQENQFVASSSNRLGINHGCTVLTLLDKAVFYWDSCVKNGSNVYCLQVTLSSLYEAASIYALLDMPIKELECLKLLQQLMLENTGNLDIHKRSLHYQNVQLLTQLVSACLRLGLIDEARQHLSCLSSLGDEESHGRVSLRNGNDKAKTIVALAKSEWLLAIGEVEHAVQMIVGVLHSGGSPSSEGKAAALTTSKCLYMGMACRLLARAGSEHGSVCLPIHRVSPLEHAHEAVRMHTSLYSFVMGDRSYGNNWFSSKDGDVSCTMALRELIVSLDYAAHVHLLAEDVRSVRCYCKEGLSLADALPLRAAAFLLHVARADSLSALHGDCQARLSSAAFLLNGVTESAAKDVIPASLCTVKLMCGQCRMDDAGHVSPVIEESDESDESFIKSRPLVTTGDLDDSSETPPMLPHAKDLSTDIMASPRLAKKTLPLLGLAAAGHESSCTCCNCGGSGGQFVVLQRLVIMHAVRQSEGLLSEGSYAAAEEMATAAFELASRFAVKAQQWSVFSSGAAGAATAVFAGPAIAAGRVLLEALIATGVHTHAAFAWQKLSSMYGANFCAHLHEPALVDAESLALLPSVLMHTAQHSPLSEEVLGRSVSAPAEQSAVMACDGDAAAVLSPHASMPQDVVQPIRQKVKKSRIKKAIHFDDSDLTLDNVQQETRNVLSVRTDASTPCRKGNSVTPSVAKHLSTVTKDSTSPLEPLSAYAKLDKWRATRRCTTPAPGSNKSTLNKSRVAKTAKAKENAQPLSSAGRFAVFLDSSKDDQSGPGLATPTQTTGRKRATLATSDKHMELLRDSPVPPARQGKKSQNTGRDMVASQAAKPSSLSLSSQQPVTLGRRQSARQRSVATVETMRSADSQSSSPAEALPRGCNMVYELCEESPAGPAVPQDDADIREVMPSMSRVHETSPSGLLSECKIYALDETVEIMRGSKRRPILRKDVSDDMEQKYLSTHTHHACDADSSNSVHAAAPWKTSVEQPKLTALLGRLHAALPDCVRSRDLIDLCDRLESLCEKVRYFPPPALYRRLNNALAVSHYALDNQLESAWHLCESAALTFRHIAQRNYSRKLRRCVKDLSGQSRLKQLARCQELLNFGKQAQEFTAVIDRLPADWTVCQLSVVQLPGHATGCGHLYITRLERGQRPLVSHVPAFSIRGKDFLNEFADIMTCSKDSMLLSDYKVWWAERMGLNKRMEELTRSLETQLLGCWKGMLLGSRKAAAAGVVQQTADMAGDVCHDFTKVTGLSQRHFKLWLESAITCTPEEVLLSLMAHVRPLSNHEECRPDKAKLMELAANIVSAANAVFGGCIGERDPMLLIVDKTLQHLPWESIPALRSQQVTRMPSLAFIDAHLAYQSLDAQSIVNTGVDNRKTFYVLNPDGNLPKTEDSFKAWFQNESGWDGVIGREPRGDELATALTTADILLYCGHGTGSKYLDGESIQALFCRSASVLMGCSSGALIARGTLDAAGMVLNYFMAGCPCVIANLWDVTDRDIDRFLQALLKLWLVDDGSAGADVHQKSLLHSIESARKACKLPYMIGASPVVYGIPVSRK